MCYCDLSLDCEKYRLFLNEYYLQFLNIFFKVIFNVLQAVHHAISIKL